MASSYLSFKLTNLSFTHRIGSTNIEKSMPATIISAQPYHGTENGKSKTMPSSSSSFLASSLIFVLILFVVLFFLGGLKMKKEPRSVLE